MGFAELCQNALAKLRAQKKLFFISLLPLLALGALLYSLSGKYLSPLLSIYRDLQNTNQLDLQFLEQLSVLKELLQGSYWPYLLGGLLVLLLCYLIHTLNIYELLTLNATGHSAGTTQLARATFFYFPKLCLGTVIKFLLLYFLGVLLSWWAWPVLLNLGVLLCLAFLLRFSNTLQVLDVPFWKAYYLSLRSNFLEIGSNFRALLLYVIITIVVLSCLGLALEIFIFLNSTLALPMLALVLLIIVLCYLFLLSVDIFLFLYIYQNNKQRLL